MNVPSRRSLSFPLLLLILVAFALRIYHLDTQSLWYDEGVTATLTQRTFTELTTWTAHDIQPPLYYYVVAGWGRLAGWSEWSLRFVSAWWGTLLVPLMALLSYKLVRAPAIAVVAALLTAFHPLFVYYSQEARMYTMVVALGVLAGYYFWDALSATTHSRTRWLRYIIVATAAVYTHYFAFFLLLAFGTAGLFNGSVGWVDRAGKVRHRLLALIGAHVVIVLLFAAWLAPLLTQLVTDRSYWQGTFKVGEAVHALVLRFVVGETVLEQFAPKYLWVATFVTVLGVVPLLAQAWAHRRRRAVFCFVVSWLLIPAFCVLTLAVAVPKFNVRYVLLALPGLILLWSYGSSALMAWGRDIVETSTADGASDKQVALAPTQQPTRKVWLRSILGATALLPLIVIFFIADHNWFTDHSFLKAQWREVAAYVRLHHEAGEAVVLVSGHAWPVWDYYAPDLPAIHLPNLQILDVDAVLNFQESGAALRAALQGYNGAWLVNWQDEVVDPTGVVPVQLAWAGREKTFRSQFWEVNLRRFVELDPNAIPIEPPLAEELDANFGNQLLLTGYNTTKNDELLLFWQLAPGVAAPQIDWQINLQTETIEGLAYYTAADRRPTDYHYPPARWQPGEMVMAMIPALAWAGPAAMPGPYKIQVRVYDPAGDAGGLDHLNRQGEASGKTATLHVTLRDKTTDVPLPEPVAPVEVSPGLRLSLEPTRLEGEAGTAIPTTLRWYPANDFTPADLILRWRRVDDNSIAAESPLPMPSGMPMPTWPTHDWFRQVIAIAIPSALAPGHYWLAVEPTQTTTPDAAIVAQQKITVLASSRTFEVPTLALPLDTTLFRQANRKMPELRLVGLRDSLPTTLEPASRLLVTPVWQVPAEITAPAHDYSISIQMLDEQGEPVAQSDVPLPQGSSNWVTGEVVTQSLTLTTPSAPGRYQLIVVVYDASRADFPRLVTASGDSAIELAPTIWQP